MPTDPHCEVFPELASTSAQRIPTGSPATPKLTANPTLLAVLPTPPLGFPTGTTNLRSCPRRVDELIGISIRTARDGPTLARTRLCRVRMRERSVTVITGSGGATALVLGVAASGGAAESGASSTSGTGGRLA